MKIKRYNLVKKVETAVDQDTYPAFRADPASITEALTLVMENDIRTLRFTITLTYSEVQKLKELLKTL
jgi:hypothetical protein